MTGMPRRYWQDMTTEEFAALDSARAIALLPVGAIEQHGPHLPVRGLAQQRSVGIRYPDRYKEGPQRRHGRPR